MRKTRRGEHGQCVAASPRDTPCDDEAVPEDGPSNHNISTSILRLLGWYAAKPVCVCASSRAIHSARTYTARFPTLAGSTHVTRSCSLMKLDWKIKTYHRGKGCVCVWGGGA